MRPIAAFLRLSAVRAWHPVRRARRGSEACRPLAQVAAGLRDPNTMTEAELTMLPNYSAAIAKATVAARPFLSIADFDKFLGAQGLNPEQRTAVYNRAFVHVNLNTASEAEIMLIPNVGKRMAHEFEEYRPWKAWAQFDKEIGKYVDAKEVARLKQYHLHPAAAEHRQRGRLHDHPRRRQAHGARV